MATITTTAVEEPQYEYFYHDGKFGARREVLTGARAKPTFTSIPLVDISGAFSPDLSERKRVAKEIAHVFENVGFMYIKGHGVDLQLVDDTYRLTKEYFNKPLEKKMDEFHYKNPGLRGYEPLYSARLDERYKKGEKKEGFLYSYDEDLDPVPPHLSADQRALQYENQWPADNPEFKEKCGDYMAAMLTLGRKLMQLYALGLDVEESFFDDMISAPLASVKLIKYHEQEPESEDENGIGAHTDFETFTILSQDSTGGLEVLNTNAQWIPAPPMPGTFVVNVGDFLQRISNGRFVSTVHRVRKLVAKERYSIPFFFGLNMDAYCDVLPTCQGPENPPRYEPLNISEYLGKLRRSLNERFERRRKEAETGAWAIGVPESGY